MNTEKEFIQQMEKWGVALQEQSKQTYHERTGKNKLELGIKGGFSKIQIYNGSITCITNQLDFGGKLEAFNHDISGFIEKQFLNDLEKKVGNHGIEREKLPDFPYVKQTDEKEQKTIYQGHTKQQGR